MADTLNWTIHGREIQLFCYKTNSRIVENENASVTWSILGINSYDAIFSNYLLSSLCNWFRLITDWFEPVLHNTYCFIIARKNGIFHLPIGTIPLFSKRRKILYKIYRINAHEWQTIVYMSSIKALKCHVRILKQKYCN